MPQLDNAVRTAGRNQLPGWWPNTKCNDEAGADAGFSDETASGSSGGLRAMTYRAPFAKAASVSCHGGSKRTRIDSRMNGRTSTQPAANNPSLSKIGGT